MAVMTRSRTAAQRGPNPSHTDTNQVEARTNVHETAVQGAAGNRKPTRSRRAKTDGALTQTNFKEAGGAASIASRSGPKAIPRSEGNNKRVSQPQATAQFTPRTCGLHAEFTFQQAVITSNAAGGPSQPSSLSSPRERTGTDARKTRKGRRTTTRRGPNAKIGRTGQQTNGTNNVAGVRAGTKRRHEDGTYQPETLDEDETRTLRRVRRKTAKATAADVPSSDVDEAVNRTRHNKGKAKAVDVPTTKEATVGSKRRRDEEDADAGDVLLPLDPGPSRRLARRTRQKVEQPRTEPGKKTIRKPKGSRTAAPAPPAKKAHQVRIPKASRASTPDNGELEEPISIPSPSGSRRGAEEQVAPREATPKVAEKREEIAPLLYRHKPPSRKCTCSGCAEKLPAWLRRILNPPPLVPVTMHPTPFVLRPVVWESELGSDEDDSSSEDGERYSSHTESSESESYSSDGDCPSEEPGRISTLSPLRRFRVEEWRYSTVLHYP